MNAAAKCQISVELDAEALEAARALGLDVAAVLDASLKRAVERAEAEAGHQQWLEENAEAFKAQAEWHRTHPHPLAEIIAGPIGDAWRS